MQRERAYANQIQEGDRVEVIVVVERVEEHGEDVTLHVGGTVRVKADEQLWRHA